MSTRRLRRSLYVHLILLVLCTATSYGVTENAGQENAGLENEGQKVQGVEKDGQN